MPTFYNINNMCPCLFNSCFDMLPLHFYQIIFDVSQITELLGLGVMTGVLKGNFTPCQRYNSRPHLPPLLWPEASSLSGNSFLFLPASLLSNHIWYEIKPKAHWLMGDKLHTFTSVTFYVNITYRFYMILEKTCKDMLQCIYVYWYYTQWFNVLKQHNTLCSKLTY